MWKGRKHGLKALPLLPNPPLAAPARSSGLSFDLGRSALLLCFSVSFRKTRNITNWVIASSPVSSLVNVASWCFRRLYRIRLNSGKHTLRLLLLPTRPKNHSFLSVGLEDLLDSLPCGFPLGSHFTTGLTHSRCVISIFPPPPRLSASNSAPQAPCRGDIRGGRRRGRLPAAPPQAQLGPPEAGDSDPRVESPSGCNDSRSGPCPATTKSKHSQRTGRRARSDQGQLPPTQTALEQPFRGAATSAPHLPPGIEATLPSPPDGHTEGVPRPAPRPRAPRPAGRAHLRSAFSSGLKCVRRCRLRACGAPPASDPAAREPDTMSGSARPPAEGWPDRSSTLGAAAAAFGAAATTTMARKRLRQRRHRPVAARRAQPF